MKELIKQLFEKWVCKHKWETHKVIRTYDQRCEHPVKIVEVLICENCGKIKKINL